MASCLSSSGNYIGSWGNHPTRNQVSEFAREVSFFKRCGSAGLRWGGGLLRPWVLPWLPYLQPPQAGPRRSLRRRGLGRAITSEALVWSALLWQRVELKPGDRWAGMHTFGWRFVLSAGAGLSRVSNWLGCKGSSLHWSKHWSTGNLPVTEVFQYLLFRMSPQLPSRPRNAISSSFTRWAPGIPVREHDITSWTTARGPGWASGRSGPRGVVSLETWKESKTETLTGLGL